MFEPAGRFRRSSDDEDRPRGRGDRRGGSGRTSRLPDGRPPAAFRDEEDEPRFQPIAALDTGELLAAEATGPRSLEAACRLLARHGEEAPARVHVHLDGGRLRDGSAAEDLRRAVREHDVHFGRLCVEIRDPAGDLSPARVRSLRELGLPVALDGFGAGSASCARLATLPVTDLKLDPSLTRALARGRRPRLVVSRIVDMARDLGVRVVAEGVQTSAQLDALREAGCRAGQGQLFGRPVSREAFEEGLERPRVRAGDAAPSPDGSEPSLRRPPLGRSA